MKKTSYEITEWPEKTLFSRQEAAKILGIGVSTLDSLIPYSELPRTVIHKRVLIHRKELEKIPRTLIRYAHGAWKQR